MMKKIAELPLHTGKCPPWLFKRMRKMIKEISKIIIEDYGTKEFLKRMANPYFFQSLSCVIGFDWHSSGTTTTTMGALKEASKELPLKVAGGKGKVSLKTPKEIEKIGEEIGLRDNKIEKLKKVSRLSAKIDNSCIHDGYQLYHHTMIFDEKGNWAVIQQGMNERNYYARRYHWFNADKLIGEREERIIGAEKKKNVLNTSSEKSEENRKISLDIIRDNRIEKEILRMPAHHSIKMLDLNKKDIEFFKKVYEFQPENYEELLLFKGMGPKKIRALALLSKIIYGAEPDWEDPIKYSFAHGGKDGVPYPVDKRTYEESIRFLSNVLEKAENKKGLKGLKKFFEL